MSDPAGRTSERKREHLALAMDDASQARRSAGWDDVTLVPRALPGLSAVDVDLRATLAGRTLAAPVVIAAMTGGHDDATAVNRVLGEAAQELGLAVGVGSQRAALEHPELDASFRAVRDAAPDAVVLANLGACQLVRQGTTAPLGPSDVRRAVEMVDADALAVHLNAVQELLQPEGDRELAGLLEGIAAVVEDSPVPVLAKETGAGVDRESARALADAGVVAIDVGGVGGTSFARIEATRAATEDAGARRRLGELLADWGIPTTASVLEVRGTGPSVIATGGVRSGLDAAKALALGASLVGVARPAVLAARDGTGAVVDLLTELVDELRTVMVLCGAPTPGALAARPPVIGGPTLEWATQRGLLGDRWARDENRF